MAVTEIAKHIDRHPCDLPNWHERRRRGIKLGDRVRCDDCHQEWEWGDIGWGDSVKVWTRV